MRSTSRECTPIITPQVGLRGTAGSESQTSEGVVHATFPSSHPPLSRDACADSHAFTAVGKSEKRGRYGALWDQSLRDSGDFRCAPTEAGASARHRSRVGSETVGLATSRSPDSRELRRRPAPCDNRPDGSLGRRVRLLGCLRSSVWAL